MKKLFYIPLVLLVALGACKNQDWDYPDYDSQTVYFPYQFPVRTITLGDDIYDTSMDNAHKCKIMAGTGGVYTANSDVVIDVTVDNAMCEGLFRFAGGGDLVPMPANYYSLSSKQITIPSGEISGGVEVQLTDAFFADPLAIQKTYVIPLRMTNVANADSILEGKPNTSTARRGVSGDWAIAPMDYVFYAVKYINPWHGFYLRRGKDEVVGKNGNSALNESFVRHAAYVEKDEVNSLTTLAYKQTSFPVTLTLSGTKATYNLILSFDDNGNCTVSSDSQTYTASGSGKFVSKGEKNSWGSKDRDALYLSYQIELADRTVATTDTLVMRNRGVVVETFTPELK
ncbi:MAG: DUF1735 domain-containing protein [Marinilabiliaceae bacterium]|nr:DUF1735 domain-containing protein [Marinilabiliaceae bacterium]